ncbi:Outer surface protein [Dirofilaria immitis]
MNLNKLASAVKSVMERTESICAEKIHEELSNPNKSDIIRKKKCAHEWTSKKKSGGIISKEDALENKWKEA